MNTIKFDPNSSPYIIKGIEIQIQETKKVLQDLEGILKQLRGSEVVSHSTAESIGLFATQKNDSDTVGSTVNSNAKTHFERINEVLRVSGGYLNTREVVNGLFKYYAESYKGMEDSKLVALVSPLLKEKSDKNKISKKKEDGAFARYGYIGQ